MERILTQLGRVVLNEARLPCVTQICGIKILKPPPKYDYIEFPERQKLRVLEKVPQTPVPNVKAYRYKKNLRFMRGPELIHNTLIHKQFGILALKGGRLAPGHLEMIRMTVLRNIDTKRMFAIWRVDPPWQSVTKKGQGQRMGGGKGPIHHYVTPIKAGRIIIEVGGKCEYREVKHMLKIICNSLPFDARPVCQQEMEEIAAEEERVEKENINPYTFKYVIQNNLGGCHNWISPYDKLWFGKHR